MEQYLSVLTDSLKQKERILLDLIDKSEEQANIVNAEEINWDRFGELVDEKGELIDKLMKLDEGFELVYGNINEELKNNKEKYIAEIKTIKDLIKSVTEKSTNLQALELRNKASIENAFRQARREIKQSKLGQKAAMNYYTKMNKINVVDPQLMDKNC